MEFILLFFPLFLLFYAITPRRFKNVTLLIGSLIFYSFGALIYLPLLLTSMAVTFAMGRLIAAQGRKQRRHKRAGLVRKNIMIMGVVFHLGLLFCFKAGTAGEVLPLGISFYTFQAVSWLIDVYRGETEGRVPFLQFAVYICMFPKLVSGPVTEYKEIGNELREREFTAQGIEQGLKLFTMGLASKVLLADRIGILWNDVQVAGFESISTPLAWLGAVAYSLNLYFDFYGYSLMAVGLGRIMGFELPENFREPYMAASFRDFYRRWHITLGRWFCKYIYIPMGGSRRGMMRTVLNLSVVWLLTSAWHGLRLNFLAWGMMVLFLILAERLLEATGVQRVFERGILKAVPHIYLWVLAPVTWMCFAITDFSQMQIYLGRMFGAVSGISVSSGDWLRAVRTYWYTFLVCFAACTPLFKKLYGRIKDSFFGTVLLTVLFWYCIRMISVSGENPFRYFSF